MFSLITSVNKNSYYTCLVVKYVLAHLTEVNKSNASTVKCNGGVLSLTQEF